MDDEQADVDDDGCHNRAVNSIQDTAVPGHNLAHIFDAFLSLDTAFQQVAKAGRQRYQHTDGHIDGQPNVRLIKITCRLENKLQDEIVDKVNCRATDRTTDQTADKTNHRFVGGKFGGKFSRENFFKRNPEEESEDVGHRRNDEDEQNGKVAVERNFPRLANQHISPFERRAAKMVGKHHNGEQEGRIDCRKKGSAYTLNRRLFVTEDKQRQDSQRYDKETSARHDQAVSVEEFRQRTCGYDEGAKGHHHSALRLRDIVTERARNLKGAHDGKEGYKGVEDKVACVVILRAKESLQRTYAHQY